VDKMLYVLGALQRCQERLQRLAAVSLAAATVSSPCLICGAVEG